MIRTIRKKLLPIVLTLAMVESLLPAVTITASATGTATYGTNLVVNGNAETSNTAMTGWNASGSVFTVLTETSTYIPTPYSADGGNVFGYYPAATGTESIYQIIDISNLSTDIAAGSVCVNVSAYARKFMAASEDTVKLEVLDSSGGVLNTYSKSGTTGDSNNTWETLTISQTPINTNASKLQLTLTATISAADPTDDYVEFDGISLVLTKAPTVTAAGETPTFTQGSATGDDLFNSVTAAVNDDGQTFTGATLTVTNVSDATEYLTVSGTDIPLTNDASGSCAGGSYSVAVTGTTATVTLSGMALDNAAMGSLIDGIAYKDTAASVTVKNRTVTLTSVTDSGGSNNSAAPGIAATVKFTDFTANCTLKDSLGESINITGSSDSANPVIVTVDGTVTLQYNIHIKSGYVKIVGGSSGGMLLRGASMTHNTVTPDATQSSLVIIEDGTLTLQDVTLDGNKASVTANSQLVTLSAYDYTTKHPKLVLDSGAILQNNYNSNSNTDSIAGFSGIMSGTSWLMASGIGTLSQYSTITINSESVIRWNTSVGYGGAIGELYSGKTHTINMTGGEIYGNLSGAVRGSATSAVQISSNGTLLSTFNMSGGKIYGNMGTCLSTTTTKTGAGVGNDANATAVLNFSGSAEVTGNYWKTGIASSEKGISASYYTASSYTGAAACNVYVNATSYPTVASGFTGALGISKLTTAGARFATLSTSPAPALTTIINDDTALDWLLLNTNQLCWFVPVTGISGVPTDATTGVELALSGTVAPASATNKTITWSLDPSNALTGASVTGGKLTTTTAGTAKVLATITNGSGVSTNYTQVFSITVTTASDTTVPDVTDKTITSSSLSQTGVTLGWNKATDNTSAQAALQYLVYQSSSDNLDTVTNIEANGTAVGSYTANIDTKTVGSLTAGTTYYFNVIVKDAAGNKTCYTTKSVTTSAAAAPFVGAGTSASPYEISNQDELNAVRNYPGSYFKQVADITITTASYPSWTPIGTSAAPFTGSYDGNGFKISNLTINTTADLSADTVLGLFGFVGSGAVLNKVILVNVDIDVAAGSGTHESFIGGLAGVNCGTITNCSVTGTLDATAYAIELGGLVGCNGDTSASQSGVISNSTSNCTINATVLYQVAHIGGLAGASYCTGSAITSCSSSGTVTGIGGSAVNNTGVYSGGLVGYAQDTAITNCSSDCTVIARDVRSQAHAGGLIGGIGRSCTISGCSSSGNATASDAAGSTATKISAGGLIGYSFSISATITDCFSTGNATATGTGSSSTWVYVYSGGFLGYNSSGGGSAVGITRCYATGSATATVNTYGYAFAGGFGGYYTYANVAKSYSTGSAQAVSAACYASAGGFAGCLTGVDATTSPSTATNCYSTGNASANCADNERAGGFTGVIQYSSASYCYSAGIPSAAHAAYANKCGGFAGVNNTSTLTACYYDGTVSGKTDTDRGTPMTTADMKASSFITTLTNADATWKLVSNLNSGYPIIDGVGLGALPTCVVTYKDGADTSTTYGTDTVAQGIVFSTPSAISPTKSGSTLSGWYTDASCGSDDKWDFAAQTASANTLLLYAGWQASLPTLATPGTLAWNTTTPGKATWGTVEHASSYTVQLYKGGVASGSAVTASTDAYYDFTSAITETGSYTFTVTAVGDGTTYSNSVVSGASGAYSYTAPATKLTTPGSLAWNGTIPAKATWGAVDHASSYTVQLYKGGVASGSAVTGITDTYYNFTSVITVTGSYTFTVTAVGDGTTYTSSDASGVSGAYSYTIPTYAATINTAIDGAAADVTGVTLKSGGSTYTASNTATGVYTASVPNGTYNVYVNGIYAGKSITISGTANTATVDYYTVTFDSQGGSAVVSQIVLSGGKVAVPAVPTKDSNKFAGWYKESTCVNPWDFNTTITIANAPGTLYAKWTTVATYKVTYDAGGAESGSVPVDITAYDATNKTVTVKGNTGSLARAGYTFAGWSDGTTTYTAGKTFEITGNVSLTAKWTAVAVKYTATYNYNFTGGGTADQNNISSGAKLDAPATPTRAGYTFIGWYKEAACVNPWNFSADTVTANTTLYSKWEVNTYSVTGTVQDDGTPAANVGGATVRVTQGNVTFGETVTASSGTFTVTGVPDGTYNLVVTKGGHEVTVRIKVSGGVCNPGTITLPTTGSRNSTLEVNGSGTPNVVVGGLNDLFGDTTHVYGSYESATVVSGGTVEIKLTVQKNDDSTNKTQVQATMTSAGYTSGMVLDVDLTKTVTTSSGEVTDESAVPEVNTLIMLIIPLPAELQGKDSYVVTRAHDYGRGIVVDTITMSTDVTKERIEVSADKTQLYLYVKYFSTYAIGYTTTTSTGGDSGSASYAITATAGTGGRISPSSSVTVTSGGSKTFAITADEGYAISDVLVDGKSVGAVASYTFTGVTATHTIKAVFAKTAGLPYYIDTSGNTVFIGFSAEVDGEMKYIAPDGVTVLFKENTKSFTDTAGHWAQSYISFVTGREIFVGTGGALFSPDAGMTRAMFATAIGRLYERSYGALAAGGSHAFTDCDYTRWYGAYVDWCAANGIITSVGGGRFEPDREITREEMATILYRFAKFLDASAAVSSGTQLSYPDASEIDSWATEAAKYCQQSGIITGRDGGKFVPNGVATRAEVAVILERFIENILN